MPFTKNSVKIGIIGLGYVGLPLALAAAEHFDIIGFDINSKRIKELSAGSDSTLETTAEELKAATRMRYTDQIDDLQTCNFFIVTVPTPIDEHKQPDLTPLISASRAVASQLKPNDIVVYESTVYPGATEEVCVPILEDISGLKFNQDFFAGYSPERINPGDKTHRVSSIVKVTSGSTPEVAAFVDSIYRTVIAAGTHLAPSIRVAEAAKVIENTQRDVNIALINELALLFNRLNLDTHDVLTAAGTKWNFLPFQPGLVGGHCIGVDPYYLTHKAKSVGFHPRIILAGREINDGMGSYVAETVIKHMTRKGIHVVNSRILILGLAFKENCPDLRNTRVIDIVQEFQSYHAQVDVYDPWVNAEEAKQEFDIELIRDIPDGHYDAIVVTVPHQEFKALSVQQLRQFGRSECILFDVKAIYDKNEVDGRL